MGSMIVVLIVGIAILVLMAVVFALVARKTKPQGEGTAELRPFSTKRPLSLPQQILYFRLIEALPEHIVLAQVQLSRLLDVQSGHSVQAWGNRISRMGVDFVVCNKDSSILAVIELDEVSHLNEAQQEADVKKNKALASAGVRVLRWQVESLPDVAAIKSALNEEVEQ